MSVSAPLWLWAASMLVATPEVPSIPQPLGTVLGFHVSWASDILFTDGMMRARSWVPFVPGDRTFQSGAVVPVDASGMPLRVPFVPPEGGPAQRVKTLVFDDLGGRYPSGRYLFSFEGSGEIAIGGDVSRRVFSKAGAYPILVEEPANAGFEITLIRSDEDDPVRNMHLWLPGFAKRRQGLLHPRMVERLEGFRAIRLVQPMSINGGDYPCDNDVAAGDAECTVSWASRPLPTDFTQAGTKGVAVEYLLELTKRVGSDFWPGILHAADDAYIRQLAQLARSRLDPSQKIYLELSNEIWNFNGSYPQHDYFRAVGRREGLFAPDMPSDDTDAGRRAFVRRTVQVWEIFEEVFGPEAKHRLVKVMPGFFGVPWHSERMLVHLGDPVLNPRGLRADVLAVGAYFAGTVGDELARSGRRASVDRVIAMARASLGEISDGPRRETFAGLVAAHAALAKRYGVGLVAYEGGQHLLVGMGEPSPVNEALQAANRDPRMAELYEQMFDLWFGQGGGLFNTFSFCEEFTRWGSFGHLEYLEQPLEDAPKMRVVKRRLGLYVPPEERRTAAARHWRFVRLGSLPFSGVLIRDPPAEAPAE